MCSPVVIEVSIGVAQLRLPGSGWFCEAEGVLSEFAQGSNASISGMMGALRVDRHRSSGKSEESQRTREDKMEGISYRGCG